MVDSSSVKLSRRPLRNLCDFRHWLNTFYGVSLPEIRGISRSNVKEFCVGLLENPNNHPWGDYTRTLNERKRFGIAHSLFLFRKNLPSSITEQEAIDSALRRLSTPSCPVDEKFLEFCESKINEIFPMGWDQYYGKECGSFTLNPSSCLEATRSEGGCRGIIDDDLRHAVLRDEPRAVDSKVTMKAVKDGGKYRVVSIHSRDQSYLRPLHNTLYNFISRKEWLLRGEAQPCRFRDFRRTQGEIFVSGDYEAATDNVPFEVYERIVISLSRRSRYVPNSVWQYARDSIPHQLRSGNRSVEARRGQLMGSYLSFPILCLLNYLIFKYHVPRNTPVRVNGDDIVFRSTEEEAHSWMEGVQKCGLVLSRGKTLTHPSVFTLNSKIFRAKDKCAESIPFIRSKPIYSEIEELSPEVIKGRYESFLVGGPKEARIALKGKFLRKFSGCIYLFQRSLTRGLEFRVSNTVIRVAGLAKRERFYLKMPFEPPVPVRRSPWRYNIPGFIPVDKRTFEGDALKGVLEENEEYNEILKERIWDTPYQKVDNTRFLERFKERTMSFFFYDRIPCGIRNSNLYKSIARLVRKPPPFKKVKKEMIMAKEWDGEFR